MDKGKIMVARLWSRYEGQPPSRAPIILGVDPERYRTICIYLKLGEDTPNYFEEKGLKAYYISKLQFFRVFNVVAIWKLVRIFKKEQVDILHCHQHQACVYGTIAAMIAGVKVVLVHVHGLNRSKTTRRKRINSLVLRRVTMILTVGESVREDVLGNNLFVPAEKVISLGNSIEYDKFANSGISTDDARAKLGFSRSDFVFGTTGRLVPTKDCECLIDAFVEVKQSIPNAKLIFVGDGRLREQLEKQAVRCPYPEAITFLGQVDGVVEVLKAFDVFVLPSLAEGMPRSLLEAMAAEIPCVATDVGGIGEILEGGKYGRLVPARDLNSLVRAMIETAEMSQGQRQLLVQNAQTRVRDRYNHNIIVEKLERIYEHALKADCSPQKDFTDYLKLNVALRVMETKEVPLTELHVQYNPERFERYKSLHEGPAAAVLDMSMSPHCRLLRAYQQQGDRIYASIKDSAYYRMLRKYGKSKKRALEKARKFIELYESMKTNGCNSKIVIAKEPVIDNDYNAGYEIYEGHHRVACCIVLGVESITADIVEAQPKLN